MSEITQKWVGILLPFTGSYGGRLSGTELARLSKVPQQTASRQLNELARKNLLAYQKQGRNKLYFFDHSRESTKSIYQILENHKGIIFHQKAGEVFETISGFLRHAETLIIFGSYSSYAFDGSSDLDLIFVGNCSKEEIKRIKRLQSLLINEHYVSYDELAGLLKSRNPLTVEVLKNHIIFGDVSRIVGIFLAATA